MLPFLLLGFSGLLTIVFVVGLGIFIARRWGVSWRLFFIGCATFVVSQVGHIPFNMVALRGVQGWLVDDSGLGRVIIASILLGLSAGVFEEGARYIVYKKWLVTSRRWRDGVMFGAGHGGIEALIIGIIVITSAVSLFLINNGTIDLSTLPAEQLDAVNAQVASITDAPTYTLFLSFAERVMAVINHILMSLLVLQAVTRQKISWLLASIGWHTAINAIAIIPLVLTGNALYSEGSLAIFTFIALGIIHFLKSKPVLTDGLTDDQDNGAI